jgi:nucleoside 2-deoxyribosyltransferase
VSTVYLAGPINGCSDAEAFDWRDDMTARLKGHGHTVISPMVRDYRGRENENVKEIVEGDKEDIHRADAVIAYCPRPSVGTSMEVYMAWSLLKFVIVYAPADASISPWLRYHSHAVLHDPNDVAAVIPGPTTVVLPA